MIIVRSQWGRYNLPRPVDDARICFNMIIQNIVLSYPLIVEHVRIEQQLAMGQNRGALLFTST